MRFEINKEKYIETGLVTERQHPEYPYLIYNYTPECQFSKAWDEVTLQCRGLIVHAETREIVARPFSKFFNYEEHLAGGLPIPDEVPVVYPKFDGSLGILYWCNGEPRIATRGSFVSDQALWATRYIQRPDVRQWVDDLDRQHTHLFEIIYPENRIVVSYRFEGLVHLASIDTETGRSIGPDSSFPLASQLPFTSYEELKALNAKNEEGFVLHYERADVRLKVKFEDYVRLHKIITGLSEIGLWEQLRDGSDVIAMFHNIPDEMHDWAHKIIAALLDQFLSVEVAATMVEREARKLSTRKEQAQLITASRYPSVVFSMLDGKDYKPIIWKMVRPHGSNTFRKDIDA